MEASNDLQNLVVHCDDVEYGFVTVQTAPITHDHVISVFKEAEGMSLIVTKDFLEASDLPVDSTFARLTIQNDALLDLVSLMATVATALAAAEIPANFVAANHHDHIFVPYQMRELAAAILERSITANPTDRALELEREEGDASGL